MKHDAVHTRIAPVRDGDTDWRGPEIASACIRHLTADERREIDGALCAVRARGIGLADLTATDFPLPAFGRTFGALRETLEHGSGVQVLRGLDASAYSLDDLRLIFWGIGLHLGTAVSQSGRHDMIGDVCDLKLPVYAQNGRGYTSSARLSFHSDTGDVTALFCVRGAKSGGESLVSSSIAVHNEMLRRRPDLVAALFEPLPSARSGGGAPGERPWFEAPVFSIRDGRFASRFSRVLVRNLDFFPEAPKPSPAQLEALDLMEEIAGSPEFVLSFWLEPGDIQFINSHVTLHNRTAFEDWPDEARRRHLMRLWIAVPNSRPLDPALAPVYYETAAGAVRGGVPSLPGQPPRFTTLDLALPAD